MAKARLGSILGEVSGRIGSEVATRGRGGTILRGLPTYRRPTSPNEQITQTRMAAVMATYNTLTHAQAMAWNAYGQTITHHNAVSGRAYHPTGQNVFVALASKFLQANPAGTVPLVPPTTSFVGDTLTLTAAGAAGHLTFTASAPNAPGVLTELLVQKLKTPRRAPTPVYKSEAFASFAPGGLAVTLAFPPGVYACAFRFVEAATGQMTELVRVGVVEIS